MPQFTVDTHLFRELGELLVGRDSTALVELIKNAYDADAFTVVVYGVALDNSERGFISIGDDGIGMTREEFENGFLRIASRAKEQSGRLSSRYTRRFTGAKGIGRLAAHKLARIIEVDSTPTAENPLGAIRGIHAQIDWDLIEQRETLDQLAGTDAIQLYDAPLEQPVKSGTVITLRRLRRKWTETELARFMLELQAFEPPSILVSPLPSYLVNEPLLFESPKVRDKSADDPGFKVILDGAFAGVVDYWHAFVESANWVLEIDADNEANKVTYRVVPTRKTCEANKDAEAHTFTSRYAELHPGPSFQCRILVREGQFQGVTREMRSWVARAAGVRVYLEGFRILPYGEQHNDWLGLDLDYARRTRSLPFFDDEDQPLDIANDPNAGLIVLPNSNYFGAVFLTETGARSLRILVNREGFVPEPTYESLVNLVRRGIDLSTRVRASTSRGPRTARREQRIQNRGGDGSSTRSSNSLSILRNLLGVAVSSVVEAKRLTATGDVTKASDRLSEVVSQLEHVILISDDAISELSMLRVLASVGTQMAAFIHEINTLLATAQAVDSALTKMRENSTAPNSFRIELAALHSVVGDLRRALERQSAYLVDVVTPNARRRRARQGLAERFESGRRLVDIQANRRHIRIVNEIPSDLKSPPMFAAELTTVFANLLTNAVKAAGEGGLIRAWATQLQNGDTRLVVENTGVSVDPAQGERWFKPFESTTSEVDPILGQGMGLGLPITRSILEEYGATIRFVLPSAGFSAAVELNLRA